MPNTHVKEYLAHYLTLEDPGYGVLLAAPWGAGKTHLVQQVTKNKNALYVSLFGVRNADDIDRAILMARLPVLDNATTRTLGKIGSAALKYFKLPEFTASELGKLILPDTLIFDDLERTNMPVKELTGYLNSFLEQEGKRLILLANESELWGEDEYRIKEKLIGHTLSVRPDAPSAVKAFVEAIRDEKAREFLQDNRAGIEKLFIQSGTGNLRVLRQSLMDFAGLHARLLDERFARFTGNETGMRKLLNAFLALSIEFKTGGLERGDFSIGHDPAALLPEKDNPLTKRLKKAEEKYGPDIIKPIPYELHLEITLAEALICDGWADDDLLEKGLTHSMAFHRLEDEPEWHTVRWAYLRDVALVMKAIERMEEKFAARDYEDPGIILHVFAARLELAEIGMPDFEMNRVKEECRAYANEITDKATVTAAKAGVDFFHDLAPRTGHLGLRYPHGDSPSAMAFEELFQYLRKCYDQAFVRSLHELCRQLLDLARTDRDQLNTLLCNNEHYAGKPVLQAMDAAAFAETLLELENTAFQEVTETLRERYKSPHSELEAEKKWLAKLTGELKTRSSSLPPLRQWQVETAIKRNLNFS